MRRFKIGPRIPAAVLEKVGLKVHDRVPEDWPEDQLERWHRRGYLVEDAAQVRETAQAGATRETREEAPAAPKKKAPKK